MRKDVEYMLNKDWEPKVSSKKVNKNTKKKQSNWKIYIVYALILMLGLSGAVLLAVHYIGFTGGTQSTTVSLEDAKKPVEIKSDGQSYEAATKEYDVRDMLPDDSELPDGTKRMEAYIDDGDDNVFTSENNPMGFHWKEKESDAVVMSTDGTKTKVKSYPIVDKDGRELVYSEENGVGVYRYADDNVYIGTASEIMTKVTLTEYLDGTIG